MCFEDKNIEKIMKYYRPSGPPESLKKEIFTPPKRIHNKILISVAASILLFIGLGLFWKQSLPLKITNSIPGSLAQIEINIMQAGRAEQLLTIANFQANQPGNEEYAKDTYYEILNDYPNLKEKVMYELNLINQKGE